MKTRMMNFMRRIRLAVIGLLALSVGLMPSYGFATTTYKVLGQLAPAASTATITVTIASPAVVTWTGSNLAANDQVTFTTTGALPTGITASTIYFVISAGLGANSFEISATQGGAAINTSGSQSGTHTGFAYRIVYAVPAATSAVVSTIIVANRHASTVDTFRIAIQPAAAANANQHFIAYSIQVPAADTIVITIGITLAATDIITVYTANGTTTFAVFGGEIT